MVEIFVLIPIEMPISGPDCYSLRQCLDPRDRRYSTVFVFINSGPLLWNRSLPFTSVNSFIYRSSLTVRTLDWVSLIPLPINL